MVRIVVYIPHGTNDPENLFFFGKKAAGFCSVALLRLSVQFLRFRAEARGEGGFGLDRFVIATKVVCLKS